MNGHAGSIACTNALGAWISFRVASPHTRQHATHRRLQQTRKGLAARGPSDERTVSQSPNQETRQQRSPTLNCRSNMSVFALCGVARRDVHTLNRLVFALAFTAFTRAANGVRPDAGVDSPVEAWTEQRLSAAWTLQEHVRLVHHQRQALTRTGAPLSARVACTR